MIFGNKVRGNRISDLATAADCLTLTHSFATIKSSGIMFFVERRKKMLCHHVPVPGRYIL